MTVQYSYNYGDDQGTQQIAAGSPITHRYDGFGRLISETTHVAKHDPTLSGTDYEFLDPGMVVREIDPLGGITETIYASFHRIIAKYSGRAIDNHSAAGYAQSAGGWTAGPDARLGPQAVSTNPAATACWTFADLAPGEEYEVLASWSHDPQTAYAKDARFVVCVCGRSTEMSVDQSVDLLTSAAAVHALGWKWQCVGRFTTGSDAGLKVELCAGASGLPVAAGAVYVRRLVTPPLGGSDSRGSPPGM